MTSRIEFKEGGPELWEASVKSPDFDQAARTFKPRTLRNVEGAVACTYDPADTEKVLAELRKLQAEEQDITVWVPIFLCSPRGTMSKKLWSGKGFMYLKECVPAGMQEGECSTATMEIVPVPPV